MRREEEGEARREVLQRNSGGEHTLDVGQSVGQREGNLLWSRGTGLPDVITRNRNRIPARHLPDTESHQVRSQPEAGLHRIDVRTSGHVLLEHVVLDRSGQGVPPHSLLVCDGEV